MEEQRNMSWSNCKAGPSRRSQQTDLSLSVCWIRYRRVLDTQWEERETRCIKKQKSETARRKERFPHAGSEFTLCNKTKQRGFEDEMRKRMRHSHAQCNHNQRIFRIISGLNCVIPSVECFKERTQKASQQNKSSSYAGPRLHGFEYSAAGLHDNNGCSP